MSRITGYWKRHVRPAFLDAMRRSSGVPVPRQATTAAAAGCRVIRLPAAAPAPIPARTIVGCLEEIEATKAMIPDPDARAAYERRLAGDGVRGDDSFVALLEPGRVCHEAAVTITADDRLVRDVSAMGFETDMPTNPLHLRYLPRPERRSGCVATVSCFAPHNYYHWLVEAIPRIDLYERAGLSVDRFYVPVKYAFQRELLRMAGIPPARVEAATVNRHLAADRVAASGLQLEATAGKIDFLFRRFTRHLHPAAPPLRLFISRRRRGKRTLVNDAAVFGALRPLGFRRCELEALPVAEQVRLFFAAECVVGPHGAGLTNLAFCRPGTKVVEINTPYRTTTVFHDIAHFRRLAYRLHVARPVRDRFFSFDPQAGVGDSDMAVDPAAFAQSVADFLDDAPARDAWRRPAA